MHQREVIIDNREFNRRVEDVKDHANTKGCISVLEKIAEAHDKRITDIEEFHRNVVDRFDQKILADAANHVTMEKTLTKAVVSIDNLAANLKDTLLIASDANIIAKKHEIAFTTMSKVAAAAVIIISAMWTIFTYLD